MTVIASFFVNSIPCILGDCLVSRPGNVGVMSHLPLLGGVEFVPGPDSKPDEFRPCGLTQKLAVCGKDLVLAWAGNVAIAEDVVSEMWQRHQADPFTLASLSEFAIQRIPPSAWNKISLIGHFHHSERQSKNFWWGSDIKELKSAAFRNIVTAGTGKELIYAALEAIDIPEGEDHSHAFLFMPSIAAGLLMSGEIGNPGATIGESFGGAYEYAVLTDEGFLKPPELTYVFWEANIVSESGECTKMALRQLIKFAYSDDLLLIRPLIDPNESGDQHMTLYVATEIHKPRPIIRDVKSLLPNFTSKFMLHIINFVTEQGNVYPTGVFESNYDGNSMYFKIIESKTTYDVQFSNELIERASNVFRSKFRGKKS